MVQWVFEPYAKEHDNHLQSVASISIVFIFVLLVQAGTLEGTYLSGKTVTWLCIASAISTPATACIFQSRWVARRYLMLHSMTKKKIHDSSPPRASALPRSSQSDLSSKQRSFGVFLVHSDLESVRFDKQAFNMMCARATAAAFSISST